MTLSENDSTGHRKRLREKFLKSGLQGFHDYEIIELLLSLGTPRRDCKPQAKEAIRRFKTLRGVLEAPLEELEQIEGIGAHNAFGIKLVQEVAREFLKEKIIDKPVYKSAQEIFDYLYHSMRDLRKEVFKVIYLNSQNQIIETEDLFEGTVNSSSVSPREVIEGAIKHNAVSLIFVHNHPSGNPDPSQADKDLTRDLIFAASIMHIKVLDHVIIGNDKYFSFAGAGYIEQGELDFLNLKMKGVSEAKLRIYKAGQPSPFEKG
jgi:DNA repair protein RadC